jgi:hypothetical protein
VRPGRDPLRTVKPQELRQLYERARGLGCGLRMTNAGHIEVMCGTQKVFGPSTSGDRRVVLAVRSQLRRAGVAL